MSARTGCSEFKGKTHRPVQGSRTPVHITCPSRITLHLSTLYMTLHPTSHNALIEINEAWLNPGTICAFLAFVGSHGMFSIAVWVDFSWSPSGRLILSGFVVGVT